jgi:hypothetical protein
MAIKLDLEVQEVNAILRSLGRHPFDEIAALVAKIKQQGDEQLQAQEAEAAKNAPADAAPAEQAPAA